MAHPGGRPSKYDPKYCEEIVAFFDRDPLEGVVFTDKGAIAHGPIPPTFERFAHKVAQVCVDTLHEWKKEHQEFSEAYKKAKDLQKAFYSEALASGIYSGSAPIFTAKNETDMVDKQEVDHTTKGERITVFPPEIADKMAKVYEEEMRKTLI